MAESNKNLEFFLEVALNPIGSLALRERLENNRDQLIETFHIVSPVAVTLALSPNGYRVVECFLNANIDDINVGLVDSLSSEWNELKKVLKTVKGRYICETLLNRGMTTFAHKIITITPKTWWFKGDMGLRSLHILLKAIAISEVDVANDFCSHKQTEEDLCDSPEGLYCVLKAMGKSMDQPGWKEAFEKLMLRKAISTAGCEALEQVIVYGDYLVDTIIEVICCRCESYEDSTTVSLIIRLIGVASTQLKRHLFTLLCCPRENPLICRIRSSCRFDDFKRACDSHFTCRQRGKLDECLAAVSQESIRDGNHETAVSIDAPTEAMDTTTTTIQNKKRRMEQQSNEMSIVKKSKEGPTVSCSSIDHSTGPTESLPSNDPAIVSGQEKSSQLLQYPVSSNTGASISSVPVSDVPQTDSLPPSSIPPPVGDTVSPVATPVQDTLSRVSHSCPSNSLMKDKPAIRSVANVDSSDGTPKAATVPTQLSFDSKTATPGSDKMSTSRRNGIDPGDDVISMAMSEKSSVIVSKLDRGSMELRKTIFACIQNGLLALMMDERGNEVVKWFIVNGSSLHKEIVQKRVMKNMDDLVESGGYGTQIVRAVIHQCTNPEKKSKLSEKYEKAMRSLRVISSNSSIEGSNDAHEIEILSENVNKKQESSGTSVRQEKTDQVSKEKDSSVSMRKSSRDPSEDCPAVKDPPRIISAIYMSELRDKFNEIVQKLTTNTAKVAELNDFVNSSVVAWFLKEQHTRRAFCDLIGGSLPTWVDTKRGITFLKVLASKLIIRTMLIPTVSSMIHRLIGSDGGRVLDMMLSYKTSHLFIKNCLLEDDTSFFMKMIRSDMEKNECVKIGMALARGSHLLMGNFLMRHGRSISETEKGRALMVLLASPLPVGLNWTELVKFLPPPPPPPINPPSTVTDAPSLSKKDTVSPPVKTTLGRHEMGSRPSSSPSISKMNSPLSQSTLPIPSFPWVLRPLDRPNPSISSTIQQSQPISFSTILVERIVKETVDFMVTAVVEKNS